ncbi:hypothetical protein NM208_g15373 [Fusarium decemcellulare]|uniref:Uncharacterized protein n=1 Tax=Fusarium decemcellulare TaxID=57161 RepID=A0ACC1RGP4_9HYPO|nr:hypothetical protein NM208_g15373 [Fusarium decemcellulare]
MLRKMNLQDIMTGLAAGGKNAKDMGSYKFWQTQPVPKFGEDSTLKEGPLRIQKVEEVDKEPSPLIAGFEWVTMDLTDEEEMKEVYELLNKHYVEDDEAMFRFNYSPSILRWAMMPPGWKKEYHVGVRASQSRKLVAFISAIPVKLRVRENFITCSEVNFLAIHKKLRGKRLTPVLIKEITRRSNQNEIWQGLYTAGVVLPKPVSTCRYFHRALNWQKLYECGFSPLPPNSKPQYQIRKYALPESTSTKGLRPMEEKDLEAVMDLHKRYTSRYDMTPEFTREEAYHWFAPKADPSGEQVVWTYVVVDNDDKITDFFSFFCIESSAIGNTKHSIIKVAYMFYYGTEVGLQEPFDKSALKKRLNELTHDALILAKRFKFDVFNALTLMDNALFLEQQKFGAGDGQLHYYLFNYRLNPIGGGVDRKNQLDEDNLSGIGLAEFWMELDGWKRSGVASGMKQKNEIHPAFPSAEETLKHPAFPATIWALEPHRKGKALVAKERGGPVGIAWEVHGDGPIKLVLLMGLAGVKTSWQRQTKYFGHDRGDKYSVLILDNRGMGGSDKPYGLYSTSEMALDVIEVLDHVGWTSDREINLVGISMGGMIAQEMALRIPKRLQSLSLLCTSAAREWAS